METKHLTIMFTDVKGFTARTSSSSRKELHKMLELHEELIAPIFKRFRGKIVKTIGDAFMVTFYSPTDAVLCGIEIQKTLTNHNESAEDGDRLEVRVAINSGEVTIKNNDVFGEAVNITARLEGIADAGDIYFTESVYLAMNNSEIPTAEVGYRHFKGIPEEIKVYKVLPDWSKKKGFFSSKDKAIVRGEKKSKLWKIIKWVVIIAAVLILLGILAKNKQFDQQQTTQQKIDSLVTKINTAFLKNNQQEVRQNLDALIALRNMQNQTNTQLDTLIDQYETQYQDKFGSKIRRR